MGVIIHISLKLSKWAPAIQQLGLQIEWACLKHNDIIGILCGYAIRSGRHSKGSQRQLGRPAVGPAAADFPRDVCLTVWPNHKVFLLYGTDKHKLKYKRRCFQLTNRMISQIIVYPCAHDDTSRANSSIRCPRARTFIEYTKDATQPTISSNHIYIFIWSYLTEICNKSLCNPPNH